MSIEKISTVDQIEITEFDCVQVRTRIDIKENGVIISSNLHRHVVCPGDDYSNEVDRVRAICRAIHTPEVVAKYKSLVDASKGE